MLLSKCCMYVCVYYISNRTKRHRRKRFLFFVETNVYGLFFLALSEVIQRIANRKFKFHEKKKEETFNCGVLEIRRIKHFVTNLLPFLFRLDDGKMDVTANIVAYNCLNDKLNQKLRDNYLSR